MSHSDTWIVFDNTLNNMLNALRGNKVVTRMAVSERGAGKNMTVDVESGDCIAYGTYYSYVATTNVAISAADGTNPRKDIVCVNTTGTIVSSGADANCKGVAEAAVGGTGPTTTAPKPPNIPANYLLLAEVWVPAATPDIENADITDRRILGPQKFPGNMGKPILTGDWATNAGYMREGYMFFELHNKLRIPHTRWKQTGASTGTWVTDDTDSWGREDVVGCWDTEPLRGYGTYQWKSYFVNHEAGKAFCIGMWWHYRCTYIGLYFMRTSASANNTITSKDMNVETQACAVWDPTAEETLKMEWTATSVKFYTQGVLRNTHAVRVPDHPAHMGMEIEHGARDTDWVGNSEIWMKDWARIA